MEIQEARINPLVIPKILQQILDFLTIQQLRNSRIVNRQFHHEACTLLQKKDRLLINSVRNLKIFTSIYSSTDNFPYKSCMFSSEMLKMFQNTSTTNFTSYTEIFDNFFTHFGCYMAKAHFNLDSRSFKNQEQLVSFLRKILVESFPNLKFLSLLLKGGTYPKVFEQEDKALSINVRKLCINFSGYEQEEDESDLTNFISSILEKCPNLEVISCKLPSSNCCHNNINGNEGVNAILQPNIKLSQSILGCLLKTGGTNHLKKLSEIEILIKLNHIEFESLLNKDFKLRKCDLELDESISSELLIQFIIKQKQYLKFLHLEFPFSVKILNAINLEFAVIIPRLKYLTLQNYKGPLRFLQTCSSIREVNLKNVGLKSLEMSRNWSSTSLDSFKACDNKSNLLELSKLLSSRFPNMTTIFLEGVDNETARCVFDNLKSLRDVTLIGNDISDGGICGESDKILKILMESKDFDSRALTDLSSWDYRPRFPSICDLKNLQFCKIESNFISDASILFSLAFCERLQTLYLLSKLELITTIGLKQLSNLQNLSQVTIFVRNVGWIDLNRFRELMSAKTEI